jgi:hypothetical protein
VLFESRSLVIRRLVREEPAAGSQPVAVDQDQQSQYCNGSADLNQRQQQRKGTEIFRRQRSREQQLGRRESSTARSQNGRCAKGGDLSSKPDVLRTAATEIESRFVAMGAR